MIQESLIKNLEAISKTTSLPLEKRLVDTVVWFYRNKETIAESNIKKRMEFLEKAMDIVLELLALQLERMHSVERRPKPNGDFWMPPK